MDMQFGQFDRIINGRQSDTLAAPTGVALDWPGLAARLAAAHAAGVILAGEANHRVTGSGSFAPAVARHLAANPANAHWHSNSFSTCDVNQDAKADGKLPGTIGEDSKGNDLTAVRGLL